ncbi:MAG: L-threonylcarbamoyladenylate synthase [Niabella sp.]
MEQDIEKSLQVLRHGGVILYPTDTVWGLGCDATNEEAVAKIYRIKQRSDSKALIVLAADMGQVKQYALNVDEKLIQFLQQVPKPTTVIYEQAYSLAKNLLADDGSIAIRLCEEPFCQQLLNKFSKPIVSTSANISGMPAPSCFRDISENIKNKVDYVVQYRQADNTPHAPSAIVRWKAGEIEVLRT